MLRADGLRHAFGHVVALDDISFSLAPGRTLVIFGPNGAGKTTLLKVLAGLIRPCEIAQGHIGIQVWINLGTFSEETTDGTDAKAGQAPKKPKKTYKR